ncbi:unnamed protein product [Prunus armeniaca]|uniref:Cathepsin propeptide inhibitor domain-containing protein n=1 Tax=Prunus armeniaca TaxID=36596 RepID=A0A6J5X980_PRUAR|nr:unnamed protein product [Prunus armeniaca]
MTFFLTRMLFIIMILVGTCVASISQSQATATAVNITEEFERSLTEIERSYLNSEERERRFAIFKNNFDKKQEQGDDDDNSSSSHTPRFSGSCAETSYFNSSMINFWFNIFLLVFICLFFLTIQLRSVAIRLFNSTKRAFL